MITDEQTAEKLSIFKIATANAKKVIKIGDRLRVTKCPGRKRWIIFAKWYGNEIISKSGRGEYFSMSVDMLNGKSICFAKMPNL